MSGLAPLAGLGLSAAASASATGVDWSADLSSLRGPMLFVPTPFQLRDGKAVPDYEGMARNIAILSRPAGAYTLCICGGTGEFNDLSADEIAQLTRAAAGARARAPVIVGVGGKTAAEAAQRAEGLQKAGADALLVMPQEKEGKAEPTQEEMAAYMRAVLEAVDIGVMPYRNPRQPMEKETILSFLKYSNFAALKSSGKEPEWYRELFVESGKRLAMFPGSDLGAPYWRLAGCAGYTTGVANLAQQLSIDYWATCEAGKYEQAVEDADFLRPLLAFRQRHGTAMLKAGLEILGGAGGPVRKDLKILSQDERNELRSLMKEAGVPA